MLHAQNPSPVALHPKSRTPRPPPSTLTPIPPPTPSLSSYFSAIQGKVEALLESGAIPGAGSFDVLVSEWMGYALLYESMLDTVLAARDTLLKPGGAILPDVATIHVAGFSRNATSLPFWDDVYGFQMPVVQASLLADATRAAVKPLDPINP